ncbi:hypothetical protein COW64_07610 [bacterium (Candidatus Blackallbacteria) CG18_big_fil_WC_8_21_14_2_50_49_26]|nr:MAG: hypothetical protein COW64_07610 [bacterium (Candidatus Blackallbacteria) CG18_big_fil_WC_8_21_14_2_50_49_26]
MKNCPICYHSLPAENSDQRQVCTFCGWANTKKATKPGAKTTKTRINKYASVSPEEIARQQFKEESPLLPIIGMGLGLLLFIGFSIYMLNRPTAPPPAPILFRQTPKPTRSPDPTPTPVYTFMAIPTPEPTPSESPSKVPDEKESLQPSSEASSTEGASPSPSTSASPDAESSPEPENSAETPDTAAVVTPPPLPASP